MRKFLRNLIKYYLKFWVNLVLKKYRPKIIAVTGTAGKTTTKQVIFTILKEKFGDDVATSFGSMGTVTGLPLAFLEIKPSWVDRNRLGPYGWQWPFYLLAATFKALGYLLGRPYPQIWVVEFTADLPGDFQFLLSYIKPDIAVVTNVGPAHLEFFGTELNIAAEKSKIVKALPDSGYAILNREDSQVAKMAKLTLAKVIWIKSSGLNFAPEAAASVGKIFGLNQKEIKFALSKVILPKRRFDILKGVKNSIIIDSTYNANPVSMKAALEYLKNIKCQNPNVKCRKIAVLGDMLELGQDALKYHQEIAKYANSAADILVTYGSLFQKTGLGFNFDTKPKLLDYLLKEIEKGDIILVKASNGMHLEEIVKQLRRN